MKFYCLVVFLILFSAAAFADDNTAIDETKQDSTTVIQLNKRAYDARLTNAEETVNLAEKALTIAMKIGYTRGVAEAYRQQGIGKYYLNLAQDAINSYLQASANFSK